MDSQEQKILELVEKVENGTANEEETKEFFRLFKIYAQSVEDSIAQDVARAKLEEVYNQ